MTLLLSSGLVHPTRTGLCLVIIAWTVLGVFVQRGGIHMFGPSGRKAYTESVLSILRDAELIRCPLPSYFRRYHSVSDNQTKPETQERYTCPTQNTDWQNDKDIRKNSNNYVKSKQNTNSAFEYAVPTSNRFTSFNHSLNC